jgi:hypothetical protein
LTLTVYYIQNCLKKYLLLLLFIFSLSGLGGVSISIVLINEVKDHAGQLRDEIHGTNQCMENQHKYVKDEYIYDNFDF